MRKQALENMRDQIKIKLIAAKEHEKQFFSTCSGSPQKVVQSLEELKTLSQSIELEKTLLLILKQLQRVECNH